MRHGVLRHGVLPIFTYGAFHPLSAPGELQGWYQWGILFANPWTFRSPSFGEDLVGEKGGGESVAASVRTTYYFVSVWADRINSVISTPRYS